MKLLLCSVYDAAVEAFLPPFTAHTVSEARRMFINTFRQELHAFNQTPADYTLYHVGSFDDEEGKSESVIPPVKLCPGTVAQAVVRHETNPYEGEAEDALALARAQENVKRGNASA